MLVSVAKKRLFSSVRNLEYMKSEANESTAIAPAIRLIPDIMSLKNFLRDSTVSILSPFTVSIPKVGLAAPNALIETIKHSKKDIANIEIKVAVDWKILFLMFRFIFRKVIRKRVFMLSALVADDLAMAQNDKPFCATCNDFAMRDDHHRDFLFFVESAEKR